MPPPSLHPSIPIPSTLFLVPCSDSLPLTREKQRFTPLDVITSCSYYYCPYSSLSIMPGPKLNSLLANLSDFSLFLLQFVLHTTVSLIFTKHWPKSFHASHWGQDWTITPWHGVCPKQMNGIFPSLASVPIISLSSAVVVLDHKKFLGFKIYNCLSSNYLSA